MVCYLGLRAIPFDMLEPKNAAATGEKWGISVGLTAQEIKGRLLELRRD
jgi:hypothetical protein